MIRLLMLGLCCKAWAVFPVFDVDRRISEVFNKKLILDQLVDLGDELGTSEKILNGAMVMSKEAEMLINDMRDLREFVDDANYLSDPNLSAAGNVSATLQNTTNFVRGSKRIYRKLQSLGSSSEGVVAASSIETNSLLRQILAHMYSQETDKKSQAILEKRQEVRDAIAERKRLNAFFAKIKTQRGLLAFPDVNEKIKEALDAFKQRKGLVVFIVTLVFWIRLLFSMFQLRPEKFLDLLKDSIIFYLLIFFYVDLVKGMIDIPNLIGSLMHTTGEVANPARYASYEKMIEANRSDWVSIATYWFEYTIYNTALAFLVGFGGIFIALGTMGKRHGFLTFLISGFLFIGLWPAVWAAVDSAVGEIPLKDHSLLRNSAQMLGSLCKVAVASFACFRLANSSAAQNLLGETGQVKSFGKSISLGAKKLANPAAGVYSGATSFVRPKKPENSGSRWGQLEAKRAGAFDWNHASEASKLRKSLSPQARFEGPKQFSGNNEISKEAKRSAYDIYLPKREA